MKTRNVVKRIAALGTGVSMVGATLFGALAAYDLSAYPAPLLLNGRANGIIVVGDDAAASDVVGAVDIAASLQFQAFTETVSPGGRTGTVLVGDSAKVGDASDLLEIEERLGHVKESLTEFDLNALRGGLISTDEGTTDYNQYIRFKDTGTNSFATTGRVVFKEDEDDEVGDFLFFQDGTVMFEYVLEFEEGVESTIEGTTCDMLDLEDEILTILGEEFSVVDTDVRLSAGINVGGSNTCNGQRITLELIGGAILDTLEEGETKTYTYNGKDYQVNVLIVADNAAGGEGTVKFRINGFVTDELEDGETDILSDGTEVGIREILPNEAEEISGGDLVEFYLGANEIEWTDSNYTDNLFDTSGVEVNEENIEDAQVNVLGSVIPGTSNTFELQTIKYRLKADSPKGDVYIKPGQGLREYLDEPEGMLTPNWDLRYEGLEDTGVSIVKFDAGGDDSYNLRFTNKEGIDYNVPIADASNDDGNLFNMGDEDDDLIHCEGYNRSDFLIDEDDFFVLTDDNDETGITHIMSYESIDTTNRELTFTDEGIGNREITYEVVTASAEIGSGSLIVGGNTFNVRVGRNSKGTGSNNLSVDLDADGNHEGDEAFIITQGGLIIDIWDNRSLATGTNLLNQSIVTHPFVEVASVNNTCYQFGSVNATVGAGPGGNHWVVGQQERSGGQLHDQFNASAPFLHNGSILAVGDSNQAAAQAYGQWNLNTSFNISMTVLNEQFDEDGPNNGDINGDGETDTHSGTTTIRTDEVVIVQISYLAASNEVNLAVPNIYDTQATVNFESLDEVDLRQTLTLYGVFMELTDNDEVDEAEELTVEVPLVQRGAQVFVVAGQTQRAQTGLVQQYSPLIEVGVLASEVANIEDVNAVVVGGPCANAVAAELLGNPEVCTEGFEAGKAMIRAFEHSNGRVAILVAGLSALDTRRAAKVLAQFGDYDLSGDEVVVSGTTLSDISVRPA